MSRLPRSPQISPDLPDLSPCVTSTFHVRHPSLPSRADTCYMLPRCHVSVGVRQKELIASLEDVFFKVMKARALLAAPPPSTALSHLDTHPLSRRQAHNIPSGDFPDVHRFRHVLATSEHTRDFTKFKKIDDKLLQQLDVILREQYAHPKLLSPAANGAASLRPSRQRGCHPQA